MIPQKPIWRFLLLIALAFPLRAHAHAVLLDSSPHPDAVVDGGNAKISLRYNARIDQVRSSVELVYPDGHVQSLTVNAHAAANLLQADAPHLQAGHYALRWQVLANDGHITRGVLAFAVR